MDHFMSVGWRTIEWSWVLLAVLVGCSSSDSERQPDGSLNVVPVAAIPDGAVGSDRTPGSDATLGQGGSSGTDGSDAFQVGGGGGDLQAGGIGNGAAAGGTTDYGSGGATVGGAGEPGNGDTGVDLGFGGNVVTASDAGTGGAGGIEGAGGLAGSGGVVADPIDDGGPGGSSGVGGGSAGVGGGSAGAGGNGNGEAGGQGGNGGVDVGGAGAGGNGDSADAGLGGNVEAAAGGWGGNDDPDGGAGIGGGLGIGGGTGDGGGAGSEGGTGYQVQCQYLREPDADLAMLKSLADFRARARDDVNGGFFTYVKPDGTVSSDHRKSFVSQTRDAWTFSRAFMVTGDEVYLDHAAHALEHLYSHGWDSTWGGWFFIGDELGALTPLQRWSDPNTYKGSFIQHYALLGIGAMCDATRGAGTCAWLEKGRRFLDEKMWDSNPSQLGYYETGSLDLSTVGSKSFTATVDAMTTHAIQMSLLWPTNGVYRQRLLDLADITADRLAANMDLSIAKFGFPENYKSDWSVDRSQTGGWVGHVLKSAWVLARTYLRHPDVRYRQAARKLLYEVLNNGGWDEAHGVPYTNTNWTSGPTDKGQTECWEIEQAITGGLSNWYISEDQTDRDTFLRMADRSLCFFANNVVDHNLGGTYKMNYVTGAPKGTSKSNEYNVEYHSTETFYFAYLYGNLMLHRSPVTLYYKVAASTNEQVIQLNPVSIDDASLQIRSVTLDGAPLTTFSGASREVTLAANQGGKLAVVFGPAN